MTNKINSENYIAIRRKNLYNAINNSCAKAVERLFGKSGKWVYFRTNSELFAELEKFKANAEKTGLNEKEIGIIAVKCGVKRIPKKYK